MVFGLSVVARGRPPRIVPAVSATLGERARLAPRFCAATPRFPSTTPGRGKSEKTEIDRGSVDFVLTMG